MANWVGVRWCPHCKGVLEAGYVRPTWSRLGPRASHACPRCGEAILLRCEWPEMSPQMKAAEAAELLLPGFLVSMVVLGVAAFAGWLKHPLAKAWLGLFDGLGFPLGPALAMSPPVLLALGLLLWLRVRRSIRRFEATAAAPAGSPAAPSAARR